MNTRVTILAPRRANEYVAVQRVHVPSFLPDADKVKAAKELLKAREFAVSPSHVFKIYAR